MPILELAQVKESQGTRELGCWGSRELRRIRREERIVGVAPDPALTRFDRTDQGVVGLFDVPMHMLVLGGIAAANIAAD